MAKRLALHLKLNEDLCYGCYSCEIACKQENNLPPGPRLIKIAREGLEEVNGMLRMGFKLSTCRHCHQPACIAACRQNAIAKREDGIVILDENRCNFCQECVAACPYGALQVNPIKQVVQKCNLCFARIDAGREPACVHHCPIKALVVAGLE